MNYLYSRNKILIERTEKEHQKYFTIKKLRKLTVKLLVSHLATTDNQESLTGWIMGWSGACTFPIVKPVLDDANARKAIKAMIANQKG